MQNLDPAERAIWKAECKEMRALARAHPAYAMEMIQCADYEHKLGVWNLRLVQETFLKPPMYHASVSFLKEFGSELVYDEKGVPIFDAPKEGMVKCAEWNHEELDTARHLLGDLVGPLINREDQRVIEQKGGIALHWLIETKDAHRRTENQDGNH